MAGQNEPTNINTYKRRWNFNIGVIIFGVIFIYLVITVLTYLTAHRVAMYEVREGTILKDTAYTGFAVRSEKVIDAGADGYVNFYTAEGSKISAGTNIYLLTNKAVSEADTKGETAEREVTDEVQKAVLTKTQAFAEQFAGDHFSEVYTFRSEVDHALNRDSNQNRKELLNTLIDSDAYPDLKVFAAKEEGILMYATDGYEETGLNDVTEKELLKSDYAERRTNNNDKISKDAPIGRLITSEEWSLVIKLTENTVKDLADAKRVKVRFAKDNETMWANLAIVKKSDKEVYGQLTFKKGMIRYAADRYLDIELVLEDQSGLKIPKSAKTTKDFYTVPEIYLTQGGNSSSEGVMLRGEDKSGEAITKFQAVDVYYRDEENGIVYLDPNAFEKDAVLLKPDSTETYALKETKQLNGVYNINKGYAVFKQIQILCSSDEYYIVESGNNYGLSNYDHIVLDGKSVQENDVVF